MALEAVCDAPKSACPLVSSPAHCLIVDNDLKYRHGLKAMFSVRGFTAWEASSLEEAENVLRKQANIRWFLINANRENEGGLALYSKLIALKPNPWCCFLCDSEKVVRECNWPVDSSCVMVRFRGNLFRILIAARALDSKYRR